ncbi:MAG: hypothetical protein CMJ47_00400 [Planctomyces sp.]|nr:hypothetical protein [Planctomyces sp.]
MAHPQPFAWPATTENLRDQPAKASTQFNVPEESRMPNLAHCRFSGTTESQFMQRSPHFPGPAVSIRPVLAIARKTAGVR